MLFTEEHGADAFPEILVRERRRLVGRCVTLVHDTQAGEDLAQETLFEAIV